MLISHFSSNFPYVLLLFTFLKYCYMYQFIWQSPFLIRKIFLQTRKPAIQQNFSFLWKHPVQYFSEKVTKSSSLTIFNILYFLIFPCHMLIILLFLTKSVKLGTSFFTGIFLLFNKITNTRYNNIKILSPALAISENIYAFVVNQQHSIFLNLSFCFLQQHKSPVFNWTTRFWYISTLLFLNQHMKLIK